MLYRLVLSLWKHCTLHHASIWYSTVYVEGWEGWASHFLAESFRGVDSVTCCHLSTRIWTWQDETFMLSEEELWYSSRTPWESRCRRKGAVQPVQTLCVNDKNSADMWRQLLLYEIVHAIRILDSSYEVLCCHLVVRTYSTTSTKRQEYYRVDNALRHNSLKDKYKRINSMAPLC